MDQEAFHAFTLYDRDGDGFITPDEMRRYLSSALRTSGMPAHQVASAAHEATMQCFRTSDRNQDGVLSFDEFKRWYETSSLPLSSLASSSPLGPAGPRTRGPSNPSATFFEIRVLRATYCYNDGFHEEDRPFGTGYGGRNRVSKRRKRARVVNSIDPSVKKFYKNVFVAYELHMEEEVRVDDAPSPRLQRRSWSVFKRYSSLHSFVKQLRQQLPRGVKATFPPKVIGKVNVEERRVGLEWFLKTLLREPAMRQRPLVQRFLRDSDAEPAGDAVSGGTNGGSPKLLPSPDLSSPALLQAPMASFAGSQSPASLPDGSSIYSASEFGGRGDSDVRGTGHSGGGFGFDYFLGNGARHHRQQQKEFSSLAHLESGGGDHGEGGLDWSDGMTPEEKLDDLGIRLPPPLPGCLERIDKPLKAPSAPQESATSIHNTSSASLVVTVTVKLSAVTNALRREHIKKDNKNASPSSSMDQLQWEVERAVGLHVLAQLDLASRKDLSSVTVISLHGSGILGRGSGASPSYSLSRSTDHTMTPPSRQSTWRAGEGENGRRIIAATRSLLREVLGPRGHSVLNSHSEASLRDFFRRADTNGDGRLTPDELRGALGSLGLPTTDVYVQMMLDIADTDGNGSLDYSEFLEFVCIERDESEADVRAAFARFDVDGDGRVNASDLKEALYRQGQDVSYEEARTIIERCVASSRGTFSPKSEHANGLGSGFGGGGHLSYNFGGHVSLGYRDFRSMMTDGSSNDSSTGNPSSGGGDGAVIVTAHIAVDEEAIRHDDFEQRLTSVRGLRIRKVHLSRPSRSGMRSFTLENSSTVPDYPHVLTWRKTGFKRGTTGCFDLRQLADVVAVQKEANVPSYPGSSGSGSGGGGGGGGGTATEIILFGMSGGGSPDMQLQQQHQHQPKEQQRASDKPSLQVQLVSTAGSRLVLEARSANEQRTLLDGFRKLKEKVRTAVTLGVPMATSGGTKRLSESAERSQLEEKLVSEFARHDLGNTGFIDPIRLGQTLMQSGVTVDKADLAAIMQSSAFPESPTSLRPSGTTTSTNRRSVLVTASDGQQLVDYHAFAAELVALTDPELHAKKAVEAAVLDALRPFADHGNGTTEAGTGAAGSSIAPFAISSFALGQALASGLFLTAHSSLTADLAQFAAGEAKSGATGLNYSGNEVIDCRQFARVIAGLDAEASARFELAKKQRRERVAHDASTAYMDAKAAAVSDVFSRFEAEEGAMTLVNFGLALSQIGGKLTKEDISELLGGELGRNKKSAAVANGMVRWRIVLADLVKKLVEADEQAWRLSFNKWDRNHDGRLTVRELEYALASLGKERARVEVEDLLRSADANLDGALAFSEFCTVVKLAGILAK